MKHFYLKTIFAWLMMTMLFPLAIHAEEGYYYIGSQNNWDPGNKTYQFTKLSDGKTWTLTMNAHSSDEFKIAPLSVESWDDWDKMLCVPEGSSGLSGNMSYGGANFSVTSSNMTSYTINIVPSEMTYEITINENSEVQGDGTLGNPYNVAAAIQKAGELAKGETSAAQYYIKGKISQIKNAFSTQYGTAIFWISDNGTTDNQFYIYATYYLENKSWQDGYTQIAVGDDVIIYGKLSNYNGTLETANRESYIYSLNGMTSLLEINGKGTTPENALTVAEAITIAKNLKKGCSSEKFYYIHGTGGFLNFFDSHYYDSQLYGGGIIEGSDNSSLNCTRLYYFNYKVPLENILLEECDIIIYAELTNKAEDVEKTKRTNAVMDYDLEITDGCLYSVDGNTELLKENDLFVSRSLEGVDMVFSVIDAENKTCQVGGKDPVNEGRYYYTVVNNYSGEITIPEYAHEYKVIGINNCAFESHSDLIGVAIPNSVTHIHEKAFDKCYGLNKVIISDLAAWCGITFESNPLSIAHHLYNVDGTEITDLIIPDGVETINSYAFYGGSNFKSVTIPSSLKTISDYSFYGCDNLKKVIIPNIGGWCNIQLSNSNPLSIAHHIYSESNTEIFDLQIPDGVSNINPYVFSGCNNLKTVSIPGSLTTIGSDAFKDCNSLEKVIISDLTAWCGITFESNPLNLAHHLYNVNGAEITDLIIPDGVEIINSYAFYGGSNFMSVAIPSSLKTIGDYSFYGCDNLSKVIVPDLAAWCNINLGSNVSGGSNPISISGHLYSDYEHEIMDLVIPYGVTNINDGAFYGGKFYSLALPTSLKTIGNYAFSLCPNITSVVIPNGVTTIGMGAFGLCDKLATVVIPNSVSSIGKSAFANCLSLYSVTSLINIPFNLDESAFQYLGSGYDKNIIYMAATLYVPRGRNAMYGNVQGWKNFTNIMETDTKYSLTYMLDGEVYKNYEIQATEVITPEPDPYREGYEFSGWSAIPSVMPAHDVVVTGSFTPSTGINTTSLDESTVECYYSIDGQRINTPQRGVNIIKMKDGSTKKIMVK